MIRTFDLSEGGSTESRPPKYCGKNEALTSYIQMLHPQRSNVNSIFGRRTLAGC